MAEQNPSVNTAPADIRFDYVGEDHARDFIRHRDKQQRVIENFGRWIKRTFRCSKCKRTPGPCPPCHKEWGQRKLDAATMERYVMQLKPGSQEYLDLQEAKKLARVLYNITLDPSRKPAKGAPVQLKFSQVRYSIVENKVLPLLKATKRPLRILDLGSGPAKFVKALVASEKVRESKVVLKGTKYEGIDLEPQEETFKNKPGEKSYGKSQRSLSWYADHGGVSVRFHVGDYCKMIDEARVRAPLSNNNGDGGDPNPLKRLKEFDLILGVWAVNKLGEDRLSWLYENCRPGAVFVGVGVDCRGLAEGYRDANVRVSIKDGELHTQVGRANFIDPIVNFEDLTMDPRYSVQSCRAFLRLVMPKVTFGQNMPWIHHCKLLAFEKGREAVYATKMSTAVVLERVLLKQGYDVTAPMNPANQDTLYWLEKEDHLLSHKLDGWLGRMYAEEGQVLVLTRNKKVFRVKCSTEHYSLLHALDLPLAVEVVPDAKLDGDPHKFHIVALGVLERSKARFRGSFQEMRAILTAIARKVEFLGLKAYFGRKQFFEYRDYQSPWPYDGLVLQPMDYPMSLPSSDNPVVVSMLKRYWTVDVRVGKSDRGLTVHEGPAQIIGVQVEGCPQTSEVVELYVIPASPNTILSDPATLMTVKGAFSLTVAPVHVPKQLADVEEICISSPALTSTLKPPQIFVGGKMLKLCHYVPAKSSVAGLDTVGKVVYRVSRKKRTVRSGEWSVVEFPSDYSKASLHFSHIRYDKYDVTDEWQYAKYADALPLEDGLGAFFNLKLSPIWRNVMDLKEYHQGRDPTSTPFPTGSNAEVVSESLRKAIRDLDEDLMW